jgi:hypothetical protein
VQPINKIARIDTTGEKGQSSHYNFSQVLKKVAENSVRITKTTEAGSTGGLQHKINYYGSDGRVTYFDTDIRQSNFYS